MMEPFNIYNEDAALEKLLQNEILALMRHNFHINGTHFFLLRLTLYSPAMKIENL